MPRPVKRRMVCNLPDFDHYGPVNKENSLNETVIMSIEEFETIRLIDLDGLDQEQCAQSMGVARSTVQRIYNDARKKLADSIINGKTLKIKGGNYLLCSGEHRHQGCGKCRRFQHGRNR